MQATTDSQNVAPHTEPPTYEFVEDSVVLGECVHVDSPIIKWNVNISQEHWVRRVTTPSTIGQTSPRDGDAPTSVRFRLRSVVVDMRGRELFTPTELEFSARPTKWPSMVSIVINDSDVDLRRGGDSGADSVADVTDLLREGNNEVEVNALFRPAEKESGCAYLMAVEIVCMASYDQIEAMATRISTTDVLRAITDSMKSRNGSLDTQSVIAINVIDPLTFRVWRTPVRGKECRHRECFDLKGFLSRGREGVNHGGLTDPNRWNCPICGRNARPNQLVIDEFLLDVRKNLSENNRLLCAKEILIKEDGTWEPGFGPSTFEDPPQGMAGTRKSTPPL
ncbi:hypothetical protein CLAIMM_01400 [Cladophialophora immunda]|nr:hypothetical protein CLAIMM_01400 [Cladophialophora immunda]